MNFENTQIIFVTQKMVVFMIFLKLWLVCVLEAFFRIESLKFQIVFVTYFSNILKTSN